MRVNCRCSLPALVLFGVLTAIYTASSATANAQAASPTTFTYPQIVRLSYVEGDVRVARGKEAEKQLDQESPARPPDGSRPRPICRSSRATAW
jgi:hypothetical protein